MPDETKSPVVEFAPYLTVTIRGFEIQYEYLLVEDLLKANGNGLVLMALAMKKIHQIGKGGLMVAPKELPAGVMQQLMGLMQQ